MAQLHLPTAKVTLLNQGAILQEFSVDGHNIVLSFPVSEPYLTAPYFGETIGRVANRIKDGRIDDLNGRVYQLAKNQAGVTHLHGGTHGWGHKQFAGPETLTREGKQAVQFTYTSPDGDEGYPGTVELRVWYTAYQDPIDTGKNVLEIEYELQLVGDECEETVANVTNHSYFNIGNGSTIEGTQINLSTVDHLPVDRNSIPTGEITSFPGLKADEIFTLGAKEPFVDHCFVLDCDPTNVPLDTRQRAPARAVSAYHPTTKIHMEVWTTEPAFQFYTGDFTDVTESEYGPAHGARSGFCVEPSRYIHAVNVPEWRSQVLVRKGRVYGSKIMYKVWKH